MDKVAQAHTYIQYKGCSRLVELGVAWAPNLKLSALVKARFTGKKTTREGFFLGRNEAVWTCVGSGWSCLSRLCTGTSKKYWVIRYVHTVLEYTDIWERHRWWLFFFYSDRNR